MSKFGIQLVSEDFEEVLERITGSGQAVLTSPVESEAKFEELTKTIQDFILKDKEFRV